MLKVKNDYNECITNLACSIQKYFNVENKHKTLKYVDEILEKRNPENVVVILFDGMGSKILDRTLNENSFFISHRYKEITTVFPATTVAATTAIRTGLNPVESGMLGWNMYYKDIDKTITTFFSVEKGDNKFTQLKEAVDFRKKYMKEETIVDQINAKKEYKAYELMPFGDYPYKDLEDMLSKIYELCNKRGKKYIYAYDEEPDSSMHEFGCDNKTVKDLIRYRDIMIKKLYEKLKDTNTVIFVIADHGHKNVKNIFIKDYPEIEKMLLRTTSLEERAVNIFVKEEYIECFEKKFNKYFGNDFYLCSKNEAIESKLFGTGKENIIFKESLGDYIAIAIGDKALIDKGDEILKSQHAGYTDDEIYIPLIII